MRYVESEGKCKSEEAQEMVEQFEIYCTGLRLFNDNAVYTKEETGKLMDKTYRFNITLKDSYNWDSVTLLITEFKNKFDTAKISVITKLDVESKEFKRELMKHGIVTYNYNHGMPEFPIPDPQKLYSLIAFLKGENNE